MKLTQIIADIICKTLMDPKVLDKARRRKGAFTRNCKKLPFWTVMKLLMSNIKKSISATLDEFFTSLRKGAGMSPSQTPTCSQQAFSKARSGIDHSIFQECFNRVLDFLCSPDSHDFHKRLFGQWGIQPIAIDGSKIPLPNRKFLLEKYGGMGRDSSSPTAIASTAYDVLNELILDAQFESLSVDERTLAMRHMEEIKTKNRVNLSYAMFIFDRGYASKELITFIDKSIQTSYLFRVKNKFNNKIDRMPEPQNNDDVIDQTVELYEGIKVRVLRFYLPSGILETLITNDFQHDKSLFKSLYFLRWPTEEEYKLIKSKIGLTCFRGWSENSIKQEFWIAMLLTNLANVIKRETDGIIKDKHAHNKESKLDYKTNMNELAGALSRHFPEYMDVDTTTQKLEIIKHIFTFAINNPVRDKKGCGESNPRQEPRNAKWHYNVKYTH